MLSTSFFCDAFFLETNCDATQWIVNVADVWVYLALFDQNEEIVFWLIVKENLIYHFLSRTVA